MCSRTVITELISHVQVLALLAAAAGGGSAGDALGGLKAWLKLDPRGAGGTVLSAGQLCAQHGVLFQTVLHALSWADDAVADTAVELLVELYTSCASLRPMTLTNLRMG